MYIDLLKESALSAGNNACFGIDPNFSSLPEGVGIVDFFFEIFSEMKKRNIRVSAFKPNIGYFTRLDKPLEGDFSGSLALAEIVKALPSKPLILDAKRGDIASSSLNYALEAFSSWNADCVTVSPYMGHDSINPFVLNFPEKGIYILNRTSNPGGKDFQNLVLENEEPLYMSVAHTIEKWNEEYSANIGAVVGATNLKEFKDIASSFSSHSIPLLIPGVGSQGGSAESVKSIMKEVGYPEELARINSSSLLTHPWAKKKEKAPKNWKEVCINNIEQFTKECSL